MTTNCDILAPSLRQYIEENLGKTTLDKIEQRLIERHGLGLGQAIKEFSKLDGVLHEIFGAGAQELESKFIQNNIAKPASLENWTALKESLITLIRRSIEENLGKTTLGKIESRLMEKHNISVSQSIEEFTKFDDVLQDFFGAGAKGLESRFMHSIAKAESLRDGFADLSVQEKQMVREFLKPFVEKDTKILLESFLVKQLT
jgi:hypothetical protein